MTENIQHQHTDRVPWLKQYQWSKGESGNPGGRPVGVSITAELNKILSQPGKAQELAQALVDIATDKLNRAQLPALGIALDRTDGKVKEVISVEPGDVTLAVALKLMDMVRQKQIGDVDVQRQDETEGSSQEGSGEA